MTESPEATSISYVKILREIRDRINNEIAHMTPEELYQWRQSREYKNPKLQALMGKPEPPMPLRTVNTADDDV